MRADFKGRDPRNLNNIIVKFEYDHGGGISCDFIGCPEEVIWGVNLKFTFENRSISNFYSSVCLTHLEFVLNVVEKLNREMQLSQEVTKGPCVHCSEAFLKKVPAEDPIIYTRYTSGINYLCDRENCENRGFLGIIFLLKVSGKAECWVRTSLCSDCLKGAIQLAQKKREIFQNILYRRI